MTTIALWAQVVLIAAAGIAAAGARAETPGSAGVAAVAGAGNVGDEYHVAPDSAAADTAPAASDHRVRLIGDENVVRSGPGDDFALAAVHRRGESFPVIAKRDAWYNIRISPTETGWIHASLCEEYEDLSALEFRPNPRLYSRIGSFVLAGYGGAYAFDRKSNSLVLGGRIGYYVLDFVEFEGFVAWTRVNRPQEIVESLFDLTLEAERFHMLFYGLNLAVEILPGRRMVPFVTGGVGSVIMQGETETGLNYGAGTRLFVSKRTAVNWEFRAHTFESGVDDARRRNNNVEFCFGTSLLF